MKHLHVIVLVILLSTMLFGISAKQGKHLFILSGQSNMVRFGQYISFIPTVSERFGMGNIIVVKDATGGQPIRRWYKNWKPAEGDQPLANGNLYNRMLLKVNAAISGNRIATVTFIWMQGEQDAYEKHGDVYEDSLKGLIDQLEDDLRRNDINVVIGRISDFDMANRRFPDWTMIRDIQVGVAEADPFIAWVDTDDLNEGRNNHGVAFTNGLHYSVNGYKILGSRFAETAIELIDKRAMQMASMNADKRRPGFTFPGCR